MKENNNLQDLLKRNNIESDIFIKEAYGSLIISLFESIALQMEEDKEFKDKCRKRYRNTDNNILATKNIVLESTKCIINDDEAKEIYSYIYAYLTKTGYRKNNDSLKNKLLFKQNCRCNICRKNILNEISEVDHKIPWSLVGDELGEANLQVLCRDCNRRKSKNSAYNLKLFLINKD